MGYYGLGPGTKVADKLSPLEQLLRTLPLDAALAALEVLEAITRNVVRQPTEDKHRHLSCSDSQLVPLLGLPEGLEIMRGLGWQVNGDDVILPGSVRLDFQGHVVKIIEAKEFFKKEKENAKRSAKLASHFAKAGESPKPAAPLKQAPAVVAAPAPPAATAVALDDAASARAATQEAVPPGEAAAVPVLQMQKEETQWAAPCTKPANPGLDLRELELARRARHGQGAGSGHYETVNTGRTELDRNCSCTVS